MLDTIYFSIDTLICTSSHSLKYFLLESWFCCFAAFVAEILKLVRRTYEQRCLLAKALGKATEQSYETN